MNDEGRINFGIAYTIPKKSTLAIIIKMVLTTRFAVVGIALARAMGTEVKSFTIRGRLKYSSFYILVTNKLSTGYTCFAARSPILPFRQKNNHSSIKQYYVLHNTWFYPYTCIIKYYRYEKHAAMNIENTKAQMRKGVLEFCILSILSRGEAYPSDILEQLKEARMIVVEGTVYPLLMRLKNGGLLAYRWVESNSGPPRKYYVITPEGDQFLNELKTTWDELAEAVNHTLNKQ